ncbi:hypothetical protein [Nitrospirillum bahiense]|uniref:Secreted protein n=1 Tax=Nitrospirillum amazonense TaxID=28077 RepID=A0A560FC82_9PROT|nr:hypothetical protein [Nitrospirillum amazonense]TWB19214.1 hypothetical protein FBZ88_12269 [Nitrospirillum amazonense]
MAEASPLHRRRFMQALAAGLAVAAPTAGIVANVAAPLPAQDPGAARLAAWQRHVVAMRIWLEFRDEGSDEAPEKLAAWDRAQAALDEFNAIEGGTTWAGLAAGLRYCITQVSCETYAERFVYYDEIPAPEVFDGAGWGLLGADEGPVIRNLIQAVLMADERAVS